MKARRARMKGNDGCGCSKEDLKENRYKKGADNASRVKQQPMDPGSRPGGGGARVCGDPLCARHGLGA